MKNNCDFVVANDLKDISFDKHKAIIVTPNKYIRGLETKEDIAEYIKEKVDATNK